MGSVSLIIPYGVTGMSEYNMATRKEGFPGGSVVKNPPANAGDLGSISGFGEDPLEKEMTTDSSILPRELQWTEEPGRLQSTGSQKSQTQLSD